MIKAAKKDDSEVLKQCYSARTFQQMAKVEQFRLKLDGKEKGLVAFLKEDDWDILDVSMAGKVASVNATTGNCNYTWVFLCEGEKWKFDMDETIRINQASKR